MVKPNVIAVMTMIEIERFFILVIVLKSLSAQVLNVISAQC